METMITIPYEDFKELLEKQSLYTCFINDLQYYINESELDYYKKDLELKTDIKEFAKKYCFGKYSDKLMKLQYEYERSKESEDSGK